MQVGDLVKTTKARMGVPNNTIGLITECHDGAWDLYEILIVQLTADHPKYGTRTIHRLSCDLEVINESR